MIKIGFALVALGLLLTAVKIGFDQRSIDDWNMFATFLGAVVVSVGARRRRQAQALPWPPPRQADRFNG